MPGRKPVRGRSQLVLDFSRKEVADYIFDSICRVLDSAHIEYLKWDMNRSIADVYSAAGKMAGETVRAVFCTGICWDSMTSWSV